MKKSIFLSIVAAIAVAMTFSSCGEKKANQNTEEAIIGTDYILVTAPDGAKGIKKGDAIVIEPKADYKAIETAGGMFIAETESGYSLLDPETGHERVSADTIVWKDTFFEGKRGENYLVYIPEFKKQFAAQEYAISGAYAIAIFGGKITIWKDGQPLIEPNAEYSKIALLPDGKLLVLDGQTWGTATVTAEKLIQPGKAVSPKELKKYQSMKGWDEKSPVMILE